MFLSDLVHPWERIYREGRWKISDEPHPALVDFHELMISSKVERVLDLGCGTGRHIIYLAERGFLVVGLDISRTALQSAELRLRSIGVKNPVLVLHEMTEMPFTNDYFDAAISIDTVHHGKIREIHQVVDELHRVLRQDGLGLATLVADSDYKFGKGKQVEKNTYVITSGVEEGIVHHFFDRQEVEELFGQFEILSLDFFSEIHELGKSCHWVLTFKKLG